MSINTEASTPPARDRFTAPIAWRGGAVAGFLATLVMGVAITVTDLPTLRAAIAGLYGFEGVLLAGWVAHLAHGTLFGMLFTAVLSDPGLYRVTEWRWKTTLVGVVYALVLAVVGAGFVMPVWLSLVGFSGDVGGMPHVTTATVAWHLVYGLVLGGLFPSVEEL